MLNDIMQDTINRAESALAEARRGQHVELAGFDGDITKLCEMARDADLADRATAAVGLQKLDAVLGELERTLRNTAGKGRFTAGH